MDEVDLEKRGIGDIKVMIEMQMHYLLFLDATLYCTGRHLAASFASCEE